MIPTPESLTADGWQTYTLTGFSSNLAPFWFRVVNDQLSAGFFVAGSHCNEHLGTLHGGAAMTFADIAGGFRTALTLGHQRCATLQLQTHFTAVAREGEFVWCEPEVVRQTKDIIFLRGVMRTKERAVLSFDGIWKVLGEKVIVAN
ncbi:MAG TPA: PaaI family thioesterase [Sphingobium sp.]|uniref:PaaI family thioesterase n=1 Tax=Sphingobium sp. TaxID=1912891 RepID=UPI002ED27A21